MVWPAGWNKLRAEGSVARQMPALFQRSFTAGESVESGSAASVCLSTPALCVLVTGEWLAGLPSHHCLHGP